MSQLFKYRAVDKDGRTQTGLIEADDESLAKKDLDLKGLIPIDVKSYTETKGLLGRFIKPSIDLELLASFSTKLNTLSKAGIPILRSLTIIESEQEDEDFGKVLLKMRSYVEGGMTLSQSMEQFPDYFDSLFISTIRAGETSGQLDAILIRLNQLIEREIKTRETVKSAIRYPSYVFITIILAISVVVTIVVPKFADFYAASKAELPLPTKIILNLSNFVTSYWYLMLIMTAGIIFAFIKFKESDYGSRILDRVKLEAPIFGSIFVKMALSRFCYLLGTLLRSGLPMVEALRLVAGAAGNSLISKVLEKMSDNVVGGGDPVSPMRESQYFKPMVIQMFTIGMESGRLDDLLYDVAYHYDSIVDNESRKLTTRIEPVLTFFIGGMVLLLALAIFLPMWNMMQVLKN